MVRLTRVKITELTDDSMVEKDGVLGFEDRIYTVIKPIDEHLEEFEGFSIDERATNVVHCKANVDGTPSHLSLINE